MRIGLVGVGRIGAFHAETLAALPSVKSVLVADADAARAAAVAAALGIRAVPDLAELFDSGIDALVITAATAAHADLIARGVTAGLPTFCEKPIALELAPTEQLVDLVEASTVPVQMGFQRRFDAGYREVARAVAAGELGFLHHVVATTGDAAPPSADYLRTSGGFFRDCSVHDFDAIRFVTGREVVSVFAVGANLGDAFFTEVDDIDAAAALLTLDDGTLVTVTGTRYNAAGYDVRMEVLGSLGSVAVGLDEHSPLRSAEPGTMFPTGPAHPAFMQRFRAAYLAELAAFTEVVAGTRQTPCSVRDALEAFKVAEACDRSRREHRQVQLWELSNDTADSLTGPTPSRPLTAIT